MLTIYWWSTWLNFRDTGRYRFKASTAREFIHSWLPSMKCTVIIFAAKKTPFGMCQKYTQSCTNTSGPPEGYLEEIVVKYSNYTGPSLQAYWSFPTYSHLSRKSSTKWSSTPGIWTQHNKTIQNTAFCGDVLKNVSGNFQSWIKFTSEFTWSSRLTFFSYGFDFHTLQIHVSCA